MDDNLDPSTLTIHELAEREEATQDNKQKIKLLSEVIRRKPIYTDFIEKLVKIHTANNDISAARKLFEDSFKVNDSNLELWEVYVYWSIENDFIKNKDEERTAGVFSEAKAKVGSHPRSWRLWKTFANFENMRNKKNNMNLIYYTALRNQIKDVDELMVEYTKFLDTHFNDLKELISREDAPDFKDEKPNLLNHFLESNNDKESFVNIITKLAEKAREEVNKRIVYESSLSMFNYLHTTDKQNLVAERDNWRNYIEMESSQGDVQRVQILYKRMLVPFYDDFSVWNDYINYTADTIKDVQKCRELEKEPRCQLP
jgi:hypothetical protein